MAYIQTVAKNEAEGKLKAIYDGDLKKMGYVPNTATIVSLRPEVLETWRAFQDSIRKNLRLRMYELVTLAAANALRCRYCLLAHGAILLKNGFDISQLRAIIIDHSDAGLEPVEVAAMDFAQKVARDANMVGREDIEHLRSFGLSDTAILDVTMTITMRSCFSKTFDALGAEPDAVYNTLEVQLHDLLPAVKV